jgi:ATP-dependent DNA helicase RecQ
MLEALQKYFGYTSFNPLQEEIIKDVLSHHDVLVLMPTGSGKSLCYQLPAVINDGVTVVISPLISLMKDQVDDLQSIGISAASINSTMDYGRVTEIKAQLVKKHIKLLYVSPERIMIPEFFDFLRQLKIGLIAIDEAHCISEWGHDFRPEYRKLTLMREQFPHVPIIALTSTAVPQVQGDIINHLGMKETKLYRGSLNRKNLFYQILPKNDMYRYVLGYIKNSPNDSGIIYRQSRKSVEDLSKRLQSDGVRALPYHAGLSSAVRDENQTKFIRDDADVIVATIAFGMGIDKPNVRYVIHCDMPKSLEGYYQETGRAGRDGLRSDCILFFSYGDKIKHEYFIKQIENEMFRRIAYKKMWSMIDYCKTDKCRRIGLLKYFGEKYDVYNCGMCDVCAPKDKMETVLYVPPPRSKKENLPATGGEKYDSKLFEVLRVLRKKIADKEGMPPYIIFSDVSLKQMAMQMPQDLESFRTINGVGDIKLKRYADLFLNEIRKYSGENFSRSKAYSDRPRAYSVIEIQEKHENAYKKWTEEEERVLVDGYSKGKKMDELARILGRKMGGIRARLIRLGFVE